MASNTRNLRHGSLVVKDGAGTPKVLQFKIEEGNLSFSESRPGVVVKHRGGLDHWSKGEEQETSVSWSFKFVEWGSKSTAALSTSDSTCSPRDFLMGTFAGLTTTSGRTDVFTTTLVFSISNPMSSGDEAEALTFTQFKCESIAFSEAADANVMAASGRALVIVPTSARS